MKRQAFSIVLKIGEHTVASVELPVGADELFVGRSRDCALRTPAEERSVSGKHARLFWKGHRLFIEDLGSRCGTYRHGKVLHGPVRVEPGDFFVLGHVTLVVNEGTAGKNAALAGTPLENRLEFVNGNEAGRLVPLVPKGGVPGDFTIGLDPGCDLALHDPLVSRHHAAISVHADGSCWIRDTESRNGTLVNGEGLQGKERMLMDGDLVTVVYFDFRFLDRRVTHTRTHFWMQFVAVVCAVAVMAALYVLWATSRSSAADYMDLARRQAAADDFAAARIALDAARVARDAEKYRPQVEMLGVQLERWSRTYGQWEDVKARLRGDERGWARARAQVDHLNSGAMDIWAWNADSARTAKREAEFAARALRFYFDAREVLGDSSDGQPELQGGRIFARQTPVQDFVAKEMPGGPKTDWAAALKARLDGLLAEMAKVREGFAHVDACINRLDAVNPDFTRLAHDLEGVSEDKGANGTVRAYARKYAAPCRELAAAKAFVEAEFNDITALVFTNVLAQANRFRLPEKELCARHPRLSDHREKLGGHHRDAQRLAAAVGAMVAGLNEDVFATGSAAFGALRTMLDVKAFEQALAFDCLAAAPPSARRREPAGTYDRIVGIEFGYEALRSQPEPYDEACLRLVGFRPQVCIARDALGRIVAFVGYMDAQRPWMRKGRLGAYLEKCRGLLAARDRTVAALLRRTGTGREALVARLCAVLLAGDGQMAARRQLAEDFKAYRAALAKLCEAYLEAEAPERQIALRDRILKEGLPGDGAVQVKWAQRFVQ